MRKIFYVLCLLIISLNSCKSTKGLKGSKIKKMKTERVILNHYDKSFDFKTLNAKIKVRYDGDKQSFSPNVTLRMEKDRKIWMSAKILGITLAKVLITPEKVSYYEKINNSYFEGDFKLLSNWLGTDLDFDKVQQLLLGQSLFNLKEGKYNMTIGNEGYQLHPKSELALFQQLFLIDPTTFKIIKQQLSQPQEKRNITISYDQYQKIGNQDFPRDINILAITEDTKTRIHIEYRAVDYNADVSFPFTIPSGYEQVTIE